MIQNEMVRLKDFYVEQATSAYADQDFELAEQFFKQALAQAERYDIKGAELAENLANIGRSCHKLGKLDDAKTYYRQALELLDQSDSHSQPYIAALLQTLAQIHFSQGNFNEGNLLSQRAISIRTELYGPEDSQAIAMKEALEKIMLTAIPSGENQPPQLDDSPAPRTTGVSFDDVVPSQPAAGNYAAAYALSSNRLGETNAQNDEQFVSSRRRLPRSFTSDASAFASDIAVQDLSSGSGIISLAGSLSKRGGKDSNRLWLFMGVGIGLQLVLLSLLAVFAKGS